MLGCRASFCNDLCCKRHGYINKSVKPNKYQLLRHLIDMSTCICSHFGFKPPFAKGACLGGQPGCLMGPFKGPKDKGAKGLKGPTSAAKAKARAKEVEANTLLEKAAAEEHPINKNQPLIEVFVSR